MKRFIDKTLNAIESAREKPAHARHAIALGIAGGFTLALFAVWAFIILPYRFESAERQAKAEENVNPSPFASLKAEVGSAYKGFMDAVRGSTEMISNVDGWQNQYEKIKSEAERVNQ